MTTAFAAADSTGMTTGLPGLDQVLQGIQPGDNLVWAVDRREEYLSLVLPYASAALSQRRPVVYFHFDSQQPLFAANDPEYAAAEIVEVDPALGFEAFVRSIHAVIEAHGTGGVYIFDNLSVLAEAWVSDQALANFFVLTCPRLRDLKTFTYFAIERDRHSIYALEPIRETTQFFLDVFTLENRLYIRPVKVQHRSLGVMDTLHVQEGDRFVPVEESAVLSSILSTTRWPRLLRNRYSGYWERMYQRMDRAAEERRAGTLTLEAELELLRQVQRAFRIHRSGIAALAEQWLALEDYDAIRQRMIGVGSIGGKALGMLVARAILRSQAPELYARLEVHDSFFVGSEVFVTFMVHNGVWWIREKQKREEGFLKGLDEGRKLILNGVFPHNIIRQFEGMLDYFGECPCIVRSSSILEDAHGNAFSGKYESVFLSNRGSREQRLDALMDAVRTVYASVLDDEALLYRRARGLLDSEERMSLLIMRVSGRRRGTYFFPQAAGVGLSYNPWCWHQDINPEDGITRLVFGLGTRAVDRPDADYTRLVCLSTPLRRPEVSLEEQHDHSQRGMDLLDLETGKVTSLPIEDVAPLCTDFPWWHFLDRGKDGMPWATFQGLLKNTNFVSDLKIMLRTLAEAYGRPVDTEFALNFLDDKTYRIHLLQCRTFQVQKHDSVTYSMESVPSGRAVLQSSGAVIGLGCNMPIHDVIYVPTKAYAALAEQDRYAVARLVESLASKQSADRNLVLIGPGRWGTGSPSLGIPVRAGRIARACAICEVVAMHGGLVPDVSLGTHFFNDLVENELLYLACFPDKEGNSIDTSWFEALPSRAPESKLADCVRLLDISPFSAVLWANPREQKAGLFAGCP